MLARGRGQECQPQKSKKAMCCFGVDATEGGNIASCLLECFGSKRKVCPKCVLYVSLHRALSGLGILERVSLNKHRPKLASETTKVCLILGSPDQSSHSTPKQKPKQGGFDLETAHPIPTAPTCCESSFLQGYLLPNPAEHYVPHTLSCFEKTPLPTCFGLTVPDTAAPGSTSVASESRAQ